MQQRSSITITAPEPSIVPASAIESKSSGVVDLVGGQHRHRRAARDDRLQLPAVRDAAAEVVDQLAQRRPVLELVVAAVDDVAGEREDARAGRVLDAELRVLLAAELDDRRHGRDRLDVVDQRRRGVEALRPPGTAASSAAGRACPRATRAAPSPRRRCTRRRRGGRRSSRRRAGRPRAPRRARARSTSNSCQVLAADVDEDVLRVDRVRGDQAALDAAGAGRAA